jgi:hypothetical protein
MARSLKLMALRLFVIFFGFSVLILSGCGDEDGGSIQQDETGRLQVSPLSISFPQVQIGNEETETLRLRNISQESSLTVREINLQARDGATAEDLELVDVPDTPFTLDRAEPAEEDGIDARTLKVAFSPSDSTQDQANVVIESSDGSVDGTSRVAVDTLVNRPLLTANPSQVRFARAAPGNKETQEVLIRNAGSAPLEILEKPVLTPDGSEFSIQVPEREYPVTLDVYDSEQAEQNPEDYLLPVSVTYGPTGDGAESAEIQVYSNDLRTADPENSDRGVTVIDVEAVADARCILVDRTNKEFGEVPLGATQTRVVTVQNCGSEPLTVSGVSIQENTQDNEFALEPKEFDQNGDGQVDDETTVDVGETRRFTVTYTPEQKGADEGVVVIESNDPVQPSLEVDLLGFGSEGQCPTAEAVVSSQAQGSVGRPSITAAPLDYIRLDGTDSSDPDGRVVEYQWEVLEKPSDVTVSIEDSAQTEDTKAIQQFRPLVAGEYRLGLTVVDNDGFESCNRATVTVTAIPNEAVHAELTWTNPEDPDETDDQGSDVDLHMVKMGPGKWFERPYDIYFRNPNNDQGDNSSVGIWNPESPSLDIDDRNGAGPENIQMDDPVDCQWYAVGVHYYRQQFGTAYATLRIYINEKLVFEKRNKPLRQGGQFWDVARIHWGPGGGTVVGTDELIPAAPKDQEPAVTSDMEETGLCTAADLY